MYFVQEISLIAEDVWAKPLRQGTAISSFAMDLRCCHSHMHGSLGRAINKGSKPLLHKWLRPQSAHIKTQHSVMPCIAGLTHTPAAVQSPERAQACIGPVRLLRSARPSVPGRTVACLAYAGSMSAAGHVQRTLACPGPGACGRWHDREDKTPALIAAPLDQSCQYSRRPYATCPRVYGRRCMLCSAAAHNTSDGPDRLSTQIGPNVRRLTRGLHPWAMIRN